MVHGHPIVKEIWIDLQGSRVHKLAAFISRDDTRSANYELLPLLVLMTHPVYLHGRLRLDMVLDFVIPRAEGVPVEGSLAEVFRAVPRGGIRTEGVRNLELPAAAESEGVLLEGERVGGTRTEVVEEVVLVPDAAPRRQRVLWEWLMGSLEDPSDTDRVLALEGRVRSARLSVLRAKPTGLVGGRDILVLDFM